MHSCDQKSHKFCTLTYFQMDTIMNIPGGAPDTAQENVERIQYARNKGTRYTHTNIQKQQHAHKFMCIQPGKESRINKRISVEC